MSKLWDCLEGIRGCAAVSAEWRQWLGEDFEVFRDSFLEKAARLARSHPCPDGCGCSHSVSPTGGVAVCQCEPPDCDDFAVTEADLAVWELSWSRLGRAVAEALGCDRQVEPAGVGGVWEVGAVRGTTVPVVLSIQEERDEFRGAVAELAGRLKGPFLLLAPTGTFLTVGIQGLLAGVGAKILDMEEHMSLNPNGTVAASREALELVSSFIPERATELGETEAKRVFELFRKLKTGDRTRKAHLDEVFRLVVLDGLNQRSAARRCKCSEATISARVKTIEQRFGMKVEKLQTFGSRLVGYEVAVRDDRRRKKKDGAQSTPSEEAAGDSADLGGEGEEAEEA